MKVIQLCESSMVCSSRGWIIVCVKTNATEELMYQESYLSGSWRWIKMKGVRIKAARGLLRTI